MNSAVVSVFVAVEPTPAFELFTRDVDLWWKRGPAFRVGATRGFPNSELRFESGVGGRLVEIMEPEGASDGERWELGRVRVWEPGVRLVFEYRVPNFRPDESTEVEVRFEASAGGTQVTVEHRGWSGLRKGHPARHGLGDRQVEEQRGGWWLQQLQRYRARS